MCNTGSSEEISPHSSSISGTHSSDHRKALVPYGETTPLMRSISLDEVDRLLGEDSQVLIRRFDNMRCDIAKNLGLSFICVSIVGIGMTVPGLLAYYGVLRTGGEDGQIPENPSIGLKTVGVLAGLISWATMTSFQTIASVELLKKFNALCTFCREFIRNPKNAVCEHGQTLVIATATGLPILASLGGVATATFDVFSRNLFWWIKYFTIPVLIIRIGMGWITRYKFHQQLKIHL